DVVDRVLPHHYSYWGTEAAMTAGNPVMALERGEKLLLPPALYLQGTKDVAHPRPQLDRFIAAYRKAGGQVELELYEGEAEGFIKRDPGLAGLEEGPGSHHRVGPKGNRVVWPGRERRRARAS